MGDEDEREVGTAGHGSAASPPAQRISGRGRGLDARSPAVYDPGASPRGGDNPAVRIAYILAFPELNGGTKVISQHASLLSEAGHQVTLLAEGPRPEWMALRADYVDLAARRPSLPSQDLVITTYWTTFARARELALGPLAHFCQGYEGDLEHLRGELPRIEEVYSWPLPALVVSSHLGDLLARRFGRESRAVPPPLDPLFLPSPRPGPRPEPWIAVPGIFEAEVKGVDTALAAVTQLRRQGVPCRLLRFSILPLSEAERRLLEPDRYLCHVPPAEIAAALRDCDLLMLPSRAGEGFGLPALEALASGVPVVASRIPSLELLGDGALALVEVDDAAAMAAAAQTLLADPSAWARARLAGLERSRAYHPAAVGVALDEAVRWARQRAVA